GVGAPVEMEEQSKMIGAADQDVGTIS
nr:hypothetical protein [Tanacetum cinerariifolium]